MTKATGGSAGALGKLFPNIRAILPALIAVGKGAKDTAGFMDDMKNASGTTEAALKKVDVTFDQTSKKFKSLIDSVFIEAGQTVLPMVAERMDSIGKQFNDNKETFKEFVKILFSLIDGLVAAIQVLGGPALKVFAAVFAAKLLRGFNALLLTTITNLTTFGTVATAQLSKAAAAFTAVRAAGGGGLAAAGSFMSSFTGGIQTGMAANAAAMQRVMANLPAIMGIAMIGMLLAKKLGESFGKWWGERGQKEIRQRILADTARMETELQDALAKKGYTSMKEFNEITDRISAGKAVKMDADKITEVTQRLRFEMGKGGLPPEMRLVERLSKGKEKLVLDLKAKGGAAVKGQVAEIQNLTHSIGMYEEALVKGDNAGISYTEAQREGWKNARAQIIKNIEAAKERQVEISTLILNETKDTEEGAALRAQFEEDSNLQIFTKFKNHKESIVTFEKLIESERLQRLKKGMTEEAASRQARKIGLVAVEQAIMDAESKRDKMSRELVAARDKLEKTLSAAKERRSRTGVEFTKQENEELRRQATIVANIRSGLNTIQTVRIANLQSTRQQLNLDEDVLAAQKELADKALKERKAAEKRAKARAAWQRIVAARQRLSTMLLKTSESQTELDTQALKIAEDKAKAVLNQNRASQTAAKTDEDRIGLVEASNKLIEAAAKATQARQDKELATELANIEKARAAREKALIKQSKAAASPTLAKAAQASITKEREQAEQAAKQARERAAQETVNLQNKTANAFKKNLKDIQGIEDKARKDKARAEERLRKARAAAAEKERKAALKAARESTKAFVNNSQKLKAEFDQFAKDTFSGDETKATDALTEAMEGMDKAAPDLREVFALGVIASDRLDGASVRLQEALENGMGGAIDGLTSVTGALELDMVKVGEGLKAGLMRSATSFVGAVKLGLVDGGRALNGMLAGSIGKSSLFSPDAADKEGAGDDIMRGLKAGGQAAARGMAIAIEGTITVMATVLDGFVSLLAKTLDSILGPVFGALQKPLDMAMGSLGEAIGLLTADPKKKDAEQSERLANMKAEHEARMQSLDLQGASNEEIARAQSEFAQSVAEAEAEEDETPADVIDRVIDRAVDLAVRLVENLPGIIQQFFTKFIEAVPQLVPAIFQALAEAIKVLAENLGPLLKTIINTIVDNLPILIDALVEAIPMLVQGLIEGLTVLVEKLPEIITMLIEGIVEMLPLLIEALVESIPDLIEAVIVAIPAIIMALVKAIPSLIGVLLKAIFVQIPIAVGKIVKAMVFGLGKGIAKIFSGIKKVGSSLWEGIKVAFGKGWLWHDGGNVGVRHRDSSMASMFRQMGVSGYEDGGMVSIARAKQMASAADTVPALLQSGEAVLNRAAVRAIGENAVNALNEGKMTSRVEPGTAVSVGIVPNESGIQSAAAALLPLLVSQITTQVMDGSGGLVSALDSQSGRLLGYRGVPGRS